MDNLNIEKIDWNSLDTSDLEKEIFIIWLLEHWKISSGEHAGEKYSFKNHEFLFDIALDNHPVKVIRKSAQCGVSELLIAENFFFADTKKGNSLYVFPATSQMSDFVNGRVKPSILSNLYLAEKQGGVFNVGHIAFNGNNLYFRGARTRRQMISVDISWLFLDELDEIERNSLEQDLVFTLEKRLGHSENPIERMCSTPTFSDVGIDRRYLESDQRVWKVKCVHCNKWQPIEWETNIRNFGTPDNPDVRKICRYCEKNLEYEKAEWVIGYKNSDIHGYHISKLFYPLADLNEMWIKSQSILREQEFRNSDLGLPYHPKGSTLSKEDVLNARGNHIMQKSSSISTTMGVDVGKVLHVRISQKISDERRKAIWIGTVNNFDELEPLMNRYRVSCCVIDAMPETSKAKEFQDKFLGRVYLAYYTKQRDLYTIQKGEKITVDRTEAMTRTAESFLNGSNVLPLDITNIKEYIEHVTTPVKATKVNNKGDLESFYPRMSKPDHFYHAEVYDLIASMIRPRSVIMKFTSLFR